MLSLREADVCYDMVLRALDDVLQTMEGMKFRYIGDEEESAEAAEEMAQLVHKLAEIRTGMSKFEGAHLSETVKCNACNIYHHHNHLKTEWRGESSRGGYDEDVQWSVRKDGARYSMKPASPYADM
ncbi:MAG: hypothetical protein Kow00107_05290 [Planctomycetota bacterium]